MIRSLPDEAETVRLEIKRMIASADGGDTLAEVDRLESRDGRVLYMGASLGQKISFLMQSLEIRPDWGWTLWHFPVSKRILNEHHNMQLVPLSGNSTISPGGPLPEGFLTHITEEELTLSPGSTVIIFMKRSS
ncbi:uncharacterized protein BO97DRAFT_23986 [Aspergillus homomorphus CBS 101889]|uniref:Uncharacterized protein n=1 Tax=Aspergillus homomorphus (strain CBS 101889) TaxID=1450537 RepID=A0A395HF43_ASPHC|nr:hypothetical protein BO97DRAFT_23986 [Aspergillus homomorphus CBS 101889]RAL06581.1 hypothetical protein BO97DRAFT_23986 [Aspergillus homomorphus CBS 101889]